MNFEQIAKFGFKLFQERKLLEAKGEMPSVEPLRLRTYSEEESGFCRHNPLINQYARESEENLAEVLIFVVATQLTRWPDVVAKFPHLMNYIYTNNGMFKQGENRSEEELPKNFSSLVVGKTDAIDFLWKNRGQIYGMLSPAINGYHESRSAAKEEAAFKLYLKLLQMPRLGLPKAGFATQLIIGRLGCIDSINTNILQLPQDIITVDSDGKTRFKTPGKQDKPTEDFVSSLTKGGVELAKKYADYLNNLERLSNDNITKILWDNWCDIVAYKIKNPRTKFDVKLQGGLSGGEVESDYPRKYASENPSSEFMKKFAKDIEGTDVSLQHYPPALKAALKEAIRRALLESSTMAGGNVEGGPTKSPFEDVVSMIEKHKKPKGTSLAGRMTEKKKLIIKKKISEKMNPATDPRYPVANTVGLGRAGTGATGLEEGLDEDVEMEYLTEAEAKKKNPPLGKVKRNPSGSKKKFHVYVRCGGRIKKISFGDPNLSIKRDSPERRKNFRARHKCDKPEGKNRCTARYWACMTWRRGTSVSDMTKEE
jgi:hypothetical protein